MKVELKRDIKTGMDGQDVEFKQWVILVDDKPVGLLPHPVDSEILPTTVDFPVNAIPELCEKCAVLRKEMDGLDSKVLPPQAYNLLFIDHYKLIKEQQARQEEDGDE